MGSSSFGLNSQHLPAKLGDLCGFEGAVGTVHVSIYHVRFKDPLSRISSRGTFPHHLKLEAVGASGHLIVVKGAAKTEVPNTGNCIRRIAISIKANRGSWGKGWTGVRRGGEGGVGGRGRAGAWRAEGTRVDRRRRG